MSYSRSLPHPHQSNRALDVCKKACILQKCVLQLQHEKCSRPPPAASKWRALPVNHTPLNCQQGGMNEGRLSTHLMDQSSRRTLANHNLLFITNRKPRMITEEKDPGSWRTSLISDSSWICSIRLNKILWQTESKHRSSTLANFHWECLQSRLPLHPFTWVLLSSHSTINIPIFKGSQRKQ